MHIYRHAQRMEADVVKNLNRDIRVCLHVDLSRSLTLSNTE